MRKIIASALIAGVISAASSPLIHPISEMNMPTYQSIKINGPQDANEIDQIQMVLNEMSSISIKKKKRKEEII